VVEGCTTNPTGCKLPDFAEKTMGEYYPKVGGGGGGDGG